MAPSDLLSSEECQRVVESWLADDHFEIVDVQVRPLSDEVSGFLGSHLKVSINVRLGKEQKVKQLEFFAKSMPSGASSFHTDFINSIHCFEKETTFYDIVAPRLIEAQPADSPVWAPRCLLTRPDLVLLEDLSAQAFQVLDSRPPLDLEHCRLTLRTLAAFHAASILLERRTGAPLDTLFPEICKENLLTGEEENLATGWFRTSVKGICSLAELIRPGADKARIEGTCWQLLDAIQPSTKYRNVLTEGDVWVKNLMFRYDGEGRPSEVRLIDFQLVRYVPPAYEIGFFLHLSTSRELRSAHLEDLLREYHSALTSRLVAGGVDAARELPWSELVSSYRQLRLGGVVMAPVHHQLTAMTGDVARKYVSAADFQRFMVRDRDHELRHVFLSDPVYRKILTEDVEELLDWK
ncbi:uncharacterized protein LOC126088310 [Schistocerca cancellata]|uniref:uncharacterized protein LOC126088310 n=1 Tax=Schistocerca cancellata TaxID=274614 RepID=UPI002117C942|nr:uncharacterized protein LOC126088310 [Schistocerca cancellata]